MADRPWLKWYPSDWRSDAGLRLCSLAARGLWIELLGYMHESPVPGHLLVGGRSPTPKQIASLVGGLIGDVEATLAELEENNVFSRTEEGVIFSRRMVSDVERADEGRKWVSKRWGNDTHGNPPDSTPPNRGRNRRATGSATSSAYTNGKSGPTSGATADPTTQSPESRSQSTPPVSPPRAGGTPKAGVGLDPWSYPEVVANCEGRPSIDGDYFDVWIDRCLEAAQINPETFPGDARPIVRWIKDGLDYHTVLAAIRREADRPDYHPPFSFAWFDRAVRAACSRRRA